MARRPSPDTNPESSRSTLPRRRKGITVARGSFVSHAILHLVAFGYAPGVNAKDDTHNDTLIPLKVTNNCADTIWPGVLTQGGVGPGTSGFELLPHKTRNLLVGPAWEGRVWGRTNCTFNENGTGPGSEGGWNGGGAACLTGDCFGRLDCKVAVSPSGTYYLERLGVEADLLLTQPTPFRAQHQRPSPSSTSWAEPPARRPSTTCLS